ncbi:MAG: hypothetical protein ACRD4O_17100 [Bryobacteraceae bacterium]
MPRECSLCSHSERERIDRDVIAGSSYRDIAGRFGVSKSAVERHANEHLAETIARAVDARERITADKLIAELRTLRETTLSVLEEAREESNHSAALQAIARLEKQAELCGRLAGELVERQRVEQLSASFSGEWLALRPRLVAALLPYTEAQTALLEAIGDALG